MCRKVELVPATDRFYIEIQDKKDCRVLGEWKHEGQPLMIIDHFESCHWYCSLGLCRLKDWWNDLDLW